MQRCKDEEDAKFKILTENIKLARDKKIPVKTTKLAYVDNYVKPPRNVMKKQTQYGTDRLATCSPAARVTSLNGIAANVAKVGDTRLKVAAAIRDSVPTRKLQVFNFLFSKKPKNTKRKTLKSLRAKFRAEACYECVFFSCSSSRRPKRSRPRVVARAMVYAFGSSQRAEKS